MEMIVESMVGRCCRVAGYDGRAAARPYHNPPSSILNFPAAFTQQKNLFTTDGHR
jgi:hypothetical protein